MSFKKLAVLACALVLLAGHAFAQTGEIYGKATDNSGAVVPGVTVTITSPVLLQPQVATTGSSGAYRFPGVPIGVYSVKFELSGFSTVVREGVRIEIGQNAQINANLNVSAMQEVVTITGEAPIIDTRNNARVTAFNQEALQNIPSARDPWVILQQSAGIIVDRENIGGNMSGQQSGYVARGTPSSQSKWLLDGIDITDMAALASPVYYDFDAFEEMNISTGGADVTMQSPGVGISLVTKSGTDRFKGSARYMLTDEKFQSTNIDQALRLQGATSGNPIQNIKDYGAELGGPLVKGKLFAWGSYGTQDIKVGVNNFYLRNATCDAAVRPNGSILPTAQLALVDFDTIKSCLATDLTKLVTYNAKLTYQMTQKTNLALFFNAAKKDRNARDASDLRPLETAYRQGAVIDKSLGSNLWKIGIPKTYKASLRHVFSDRFMLEFQYAHVGNNFTLDFQEPGLATVQPTFEITSPAGLWGRSFLAQQFVRPTNTFDLTGTRSSSGFLGGDHALKMGARFRQDRAISTLHYGGNTIARFRSGVASEAQMYRDSYTDYNLFTWSFYLQDTFTKNKFTVLAGLRLDLQKDRANPSSAPSHPFFGQATQTGVPFNHLPALSFNGAEAGVQFANLVPRLGVTYDATGDGRNVVKFNVARYASQLSDGALSGVLNTVAAATIIYPWTDLNGDRTVQPGEVNISGTPIGFGGNYNPSSPSATAASSGSVDQGLTNEYTDEVILGFDKQFGNSAAIGIAAILRRSTNFRWNDRLNWTSANYTSVSFTPTAASCPASQNSQCPTITYFQPTSPVTAPYILTNQPDTNRWYRGFELTGRKRLSGGFSLNGSFTLNDTEVNYGDNAFEDPTNLVNLDGAEYAPESGGSGIGNVFQNATWLFRLQALYSAPWKIDVSAAFNARSGFPMPLQIQTPSRPNGGGTTSVYLAPLGETRLPSFNNLDLGVRKTVKVSRASVTLSVDVFNALNNNTIQARQRTQNSPSNANNIQALVAPRVARFGARLTW